MLTSRAHTRQRRAEALRRRAPTILEIRESRPLPVAVAHAICAGLYSDGCACDRSTNLSVAACDRMQGIAIHVIDVVRRHDRKQQDRTGTT